MHNFKPIIAERIRNIRHCTFGWVDHNFIHHGYLNSLTQQELLLYYFLITVADRNGISFYDYERICQFLKLSLDDYITARNHLCKRSLIAFEEGIFQVLALPQKQETIPNIGFKQRRTSDKDCQALKDILSL